MNKTAIKNFAIWARNKLIADIRYRAGLLGITEEGIQAALPQSTRQTEFYDIGTAKPYAIAGEAIRQRRHLADRIRGKEAETDYPTAYKYVIEEVAYTWFNRLIAVRFMEINDYLPSRIRVLSSDTGKLEPDLVTTPFDAGLDFTDAEQQAIISLKNGSRLDEVFRILFIKQCNALNEILPALFEKTSDYTELLLKLSVIDQDGVVYHLVHDIPEEDFDVERGGQVEILGWLYQYYNTEPKNEAFAKSGKIRKEEIPAVTQLFTPDWIVRYMVENSVGRLWIEHLRALDESADEAALAACFGWKYYLPEAGQESEVEEKLRELRKVRASLTPDQISLIDPCVGSGHVLVYGFSVLMQIYENAGYGPRDAAKSILEHNLYGLDIDDRAYQMAYFAVMMKAREYNRRILNGENTCKVYAIQESNGITDAALGDMGANLSDEDRKTALKEIKALIDEFKDAKEYGSILNIEKRDWDLLRRFAVPSVGEGQLSLDVNGAEEAAERLQGIIDVAEVMGNKYSVICTNPPYMSVTNVSAKLNKYINTVFPEGKADLYSVFVSRNLVFATDNGFVAMITQHGWMFLGSFEKLRGEVLKKSVQNMIHLGSRAFDDIAGEVVQTVSFVLRNSVLMDYKAVYSRLISPTTQEGKESLFLSHVTEYIVDKRRFMKMPNSIIAYWLSENASKAFEYGMLRDFADTKTGMQTCDNNRFLRLWFEVSIKDCCLHEANVTTTISNPIKWIPYNKGGDFRKWYGNQAYVLNWSNDGEEAKAYAVSLYKTVTRTIKNIPYFYRSTISWSKVSTGNIAFRYYPNGFIFDVAGCCIFSEKIDIISLLALVNSKVAKYYLQVLSPTINYEAGHVNCIPIRKEYLDTQIASIGQENVNYSKQDWDSYETSWDFRHHPLIHGGIKKSKGSIDGLIIEDCFNTWSQECGQRFDQIKENEEELNRIFIKIYGLEKDILPDVDEKEVTVRHADLQRDIKSLLSYAVGCMFGRYSLDTEGLAYAGGDWDASKYASFLPDADNVIPITDEEYLEDDIVSRLCTWLKVVYGESTLEENLDFIAKALGNKGDSSREIIRNYFLNDFFKDHCQTYSVTGSGRRPIYWLFDSGKQNGFKALIYLHRYDADNIGNLRIDYLHRLQRIYESEIGRMQDMIDHSTNAREVGQATKRRDKLIKQLKECREYDERLAHLALSRIELDLDDGVKVNYRKIQTAHDGKLYEVLADSKNIMANDKLWKQHLALTGK